MKRRLAFQYRLDLILQLELELVWREEISIVQNKTTGKDPIKKDQ